MSWLKDLKQSARQFEQQYFPPPTAQQPNPQYTAPPPVPNRPSPNGSTPENQTLFQTFEWHTPSDPPQPDATHSPNSHYARLARILPSLADIGVTMLWLPPGCKANAPQGNGYDCYDLWDLGEFDQKFTRSTKWGSREELNDLLRMMHERRVEGCFDTILNHKTAGDATEECWAVEVDGSDRRVETCSPKKIEPWIRYNFPGRKGAYSPLKWRAEHFNGTDWDQRQRRNAIYKIVDDPASFPKPGKEPQPQLISGLGRLAKYAGKATGSSSTPRPGKNWAEDVDDLHGNFDYLMFSNVYHAHPAVREDMCRWGQWMINDVGMDGFRLDAVQHFSFNFSRDWIATVNAASRQLRGKDAFVVGEIWTGEIHRITNWLDVVGPTAYCYDSPLFYNFSRISKDVVAGSKNADLRTILRDCLTALRPQNAVTLVTNHDTQPGQASYSPLDAYLKPVFYAFILMRQEGFPCVFWGDLYGTRGPKAEPPACFSQAIGQSLIPSLVLARKFYAYGEQRDYWDAQSCIGWTRSGTHDRPGCAVVLSIGKKEKWTQKEMAVGTPGEVWVDLLSAPHERPEVQIDERGCGVFPCKGWSAAIFVCRDAPGLGRFPVPFDIDVYRGG